MSGSEASGLNNAVRAWAMRTSRNSEDHRRFVQTELETGRLRQGWGYDPSHDLRKIRSVIESSGWEALTVEQKSAWGHWRMLGNAAADPKDAMRPHDLILIPNFPDNGSFTLCRIAGQYSFEIDPTIGDLGHLLPVEVLTPSGVSYTNDVVAGGLRRSLRCRSRLWWIGDHAESLAAILGHVDAGTAQNLSSSSGHVARAHGKVSNEIRGSLDSLALAIEGPLRASLQSAEWETVLQDALVPLMRNVEVIHTGGPSEMGADLEIHIPNPFSPVEPWIVAVQVKDYDWTIGVEVAAQIEQAIQSRQGQGSVGTLVAVVLASTRAEPSQDLLHKLSEIQKVYGVSISCVHGKDLMRVFARGLFVGYRDLPIQ